MKTIISAVLMGCVLVAGCSHGKKQTEPNNMVVVDQKSPTKAVVEYDGQCAMAVANGKLGVAGDQSHKLEYNGKTYYFSSEKAKKKFAKRLPANVEKAEHHWHQNGGELKNKN
jgi:YHS domain-containing protein